MSELRWHPLLREWVITATARQERTYLPSAAQCPLCPTQSAAAPTEIPRADFDIAVFDNRFPALHSVPPSPEITSTELYPVAPAQGVCEVIVYTPQHESSLACLPLEKIYKLIHVWTDRYQELGALPFIEYVFIFENKGTAVGTTLHHPHGQLYAFPYVPPIIQRELAAARDHRMKTGRCLLCDIVAAEQHAGQRIVHHEEGSVAYVPFFARFPYEVHIATTTHRPSLLQFNEAERWALARTLKTVLMRYDALFDLSFPYMMALHQAPTGSATQHDDAHFHIEFYPLQRTPEKLKYRAGCETGAGSFITDALPEQWAEQLRKE